MNPAATSFPGPVLSLPLGLDVLRTYSGALVCLEIVSLEIAFVRWSVLGVIGGDRRVSVRFLWETRPWCVCVQMDVSGVRNWSAWTLLSITQISVESVLFLHGIGYKFHCFKCSMSRITVE